MKRPTFRQMLILVFVMAGASPAMAKTEKVPAGFTSLFDGKTLRGWRGAEGLWSVVDGAITGKTQVARTANTFLIYERPFSNFELRYRYRWRAPVGNSGVQIRSHVIEGDYAMTGMQVNVVPVDMTALHPGTEYKSERFNMLYDEVGDRQEMALLGQRAVITRRALPGGGTPIVVRTVKELVNQPAAIMEAVRTGPEWTEVVVIAFGNRIVSAVNGMLAFDVLDNDPVGKSEGLIGIQLHSSPGTWFEFKDLVIKPLRLAPKIEGRFKTAPVPAPEPRQTYKESTRAGGSDRALAQ